MIQVVQQIHPTSKEIKDFVKVISTLEITHNDVKIEVPTAVYINVTKLSEKDRFLVWKMANSHYNKPLSFIKKIEIPKIKPWWKFW